MKINQQVNMNIIINFHKVNIKKLRMKMRIKKLKLMINIKWKDNT
jgi:hypothetical protein